MKTKHTKENAHNLLKGRLGTALGAPTTVALMTWGGFTMDANNALTFALAVSLSSMLVIAGAAFLGAYRFLKNIGVFKGHYYY
jgi:hypothetical protein